MGLVGEDDSHLETVVKSKLNHSAVREMMVLLVVTFL